MSYFRAVTFSDASRAAVNITNNTLNSNKYGMFFHGDWNNTFTSNSANNNIL
jgi:parallel beta-helix repeat protein